MPKSTVADWSTTAASNTDIGGITLDSATTTPSQVDDAFREVMAQIKTAIGVSFQAYSANLTAFATSAPWTAASAAGAASLAFHEDTDNGTNKATLTGPASLASDIVLTLPGTAGTLMVSASYPTIVSLEGLSLAAGDLLYATAADTVQKLAIGTASQVLQVNAGATAPEWTTISTNSYTLLGTLTTTSGTTQPLTDIPSGYRKLYIEVEGVSFTADSLVLTLALSSTNGAAYGTAVTVGAALAAAGDTWNGWLEVGNISSTVAAAKSVSSYVTRSTSTTVSGAIGISTNTAARVDAIRFAGGTFDAGTIRVYGVK